MAETPILFPQRKVAGPCSRPREGGKYLKRRIFESGVPGGEVQSAATLKYTSRDRINL
jgi:hypothetical protein